MKNIYKQKTPDLLTQQIQHLQQLALQHVKNLTIRPKSIINKIHNPNKKNKSLSKISFTHHQQKYSIEKIHQINQINFMQQIFQTKQLHKKISLKFKLEKYSFQYLIGSGMFAHVWKVQDRTNHKLYAIKQISKSLVISKKAISTIMNQRQILPQLHHHLIPTLISAFQTNLNLYLVLPLMEKGDLRYHITKFKQFQQKQIRFFIACIVSILEYLHQCGIIHRDIKPQNLLLDQNGYLHLADFGLAQKVTQITHGISCGTPAYMAPQAIFDKQYSFYVDYYALGVVLYQMMIGQRPYISINKEQLKILMSKYSANIKKDSIPEGWSIQSADFANRLLHRNPQHRLGYNGVIEIKNHPWLKNFPWEKLQKRQLISPYCQPFNHWEIDHKSMIINKNKQQQIQDDNTQKFLQKGDLQQIFNCFTYEGLQKSMEYTTKPSFQMRL